MRKALLAPAVLTAAAAQWARRSAARFDAPQEWPMGTSNCGQMGTSNRPGVIYLGSLENGTKQRCSSERIHP
jgi:hypothetical protein